MSLYTTVPPPTETALAEAAVSLRDVFCVHRTTAGDAAALQGLNLDVAAGERLCVLGPSGAGKTTLLRVIAGLQEPSAGSVLVFGRDPGWLNARERSELRHNWVGFLDQHADSVLSPDLTVADTVALPLALRGVPKLERRARVLELLEQTGLDDRERSRPAELSGGERQRVALCAALAHRPRLLLADEPTAELDRGSAQAITRLISELAMAAGTTVILVSHDAELAEQAGRVVRIRDGRVVEETTATGRSFVVGPGGWIQLPPELLGEAGIDGGVQAEAVPGGVLLSASAANSARALRSATPEPAAPLVTDPAVPGRVALREVSCARGRGRGRRVVLDHLSLAFEPGQLTAVVGRSGSGKTTLLELLAGIRAVDEGELMLDDLSLARLDREARSSLRRHTIGYLPQEPAPIGFLSARENILLALCVREQTDHTNTQHVNTILGWLRLEERANQRVERLSAGEAQRVALARALASARGLLIVDEPTSRLDEHTGATVADALRKFTQEGQTIVCATHDEKLAARADKVVELPVH